MEEKSITVLLIEDNPGDARLIQEMLADVRGAQFELECANRLAAGLERLAKGGIDLVLLDLSLPEGGGLDTLLKVHTQAPRVPIVVLTGLDDEALAVQAVQEGAQDYLVKGQVDSNVLTRAVRYAIERHRMLLEQIRQREQLEREIRSLERMSASPPTSVTAQVFGVVPLRKGFQSTFDELVHRYGELMDLALEQRAYKIEHKISEELCAIGEQIGLLKGGPRDVVELHSRTLNNKTNGTTPLKAQAYAEEGRLLVLELMGYLASYYRNYSLGVREVSVSETRKGKTRKGENVDA